MIAGISVETIKKIFRMEKKNDDKTRKNTRVMIKKYGKTLRKLSYE